MPHASTHWGRMTHICVSKLTSIGPDNGLSPGRRQAIIWTNDGILFIRTFGRHFNEIVSKIHTFSFKKMHFKMSSRKWQTSCLGLNVLTQTRTRCRFSLFIPYNIVHFHQEFILSFVGNTDAKVTLVRLATKTILSLFRSTVRIHQRRCSWSSAYRRCSN